MALFRLISVTSCMIYMSVADIATSTRNYFVCCEILIKTLNINQNVEKSCIWPFAIDCSFT